jgi:DNA-binding transcriptional ArsR family regulator
MTLDRLNDTFSALSDPTRRAMLARLALGEASVNELMRPFKLSQPAISKHIKVLEQAGLVSRSRAGQFRPCRLEAEALRDVAQWIDHYRQFWTESFDRLDQHLRRKQSKSEKERPK